MFALGGRMSVFHPGGRGVSCMICEFLGNTSPGGGVHLLCMNLEKLDRT